MRQAKITSHHIRLLWMETATKNDTYLESIIIYVVFLVVEPVIVCVRNVALSTY